VRLCSFDAGDGPRTGVVRNRMVLDLAKADASLPRDMKALLALGLDRIAGFADSCSDRSLFHRLDEVRLLPPVPTPGRYLDFYSFEGHVKAARAKRGLEVVPEWYQQPTYYNGNPYAFIGHGETVKYPADETQRDYEMELAVVIGRACRDLRPEDWRGAIAGFTLLNDCSARQRQMGYVKVGMGPSYGKDFGKALGPWVVTPDECPDPDRIELTAKVNGTEWSRGRFGEAHYDWGDMLAFGRFGEAHYDWGDMLAFATKDQELRPGDVVGSGTFTGGCGYELGRFLQPGDAVELEMSYEGKSLGLLRTAVA
jgi:fumarylacetoacetate (FAA) hydrolase